MSPALSRTIAATVEVVTPLHVGDGRGDLIHDVDFLIRRGQILFIDQQKLWAKLGEERLAHWNEPEFKLSSLLRPEEYEECASAIVPMTGHLEATGGLINQIADLEGRPYLPGSSLKGALRTALLQSSGEMPDVDEVLGGRGGRGNWAGQNFERSIFGRSPNYDLLRTLRVADGDPVAPTSRRAVVIAVYSLRGDQLLPKGANFRLNVVALPAGTTFGVELGVDQYLLDSPRMSWSADLRRWPLDLAARCRAATAPLIEAEREFFTRVNQPRVAGFYLRLKADAAQLADNCFFLPVGWGTGWLSKTVGPALREVEGFADIRQKFQLGYIDAPFPKSRKLVEDAPDRAMEPVGWIKVTLNETRGI